MRVKGRNKILEMAMIGMLSAIAFIMELLNISLPFLPDFLKMDLSDAPGLIAAFAMGPVQGILVCLVKNMLHILCSTSGGIGELCNFLLGAILVGGSGWFYKRNRKKEAAVTGSVIAAIFMSLFSVVLNYYLIYPYYIVVMGLSKEAILLMYQVAVPGIDSLWEALLKVNMPFTFCKAIFSIWLGFAVYKRIWPMLSGIIF